MGGNPTGGTPEKDAKGSIKNDSKEEKPSSKAETAAKGFNINALPDELKKNISREWLTFEETVHAERAMAPILDKLKKHTNNTLFKPVLTELEAAYYVLTGRPEHLLRALAKNTDLFFKPCIQIKDAAGQMFRNVSAADLVYFVCDDDMLNQVATFASELPLDARQSFVMLWEKQLESRGRGGADLVRLTRDPITMLKTMAFKDVLKSTQTYNIYGVTCQATFSLLKNPDGIIYYLDANKKEHWYYVNKDNETIEPIEIPAALLTQYQDAYDQLKSNMDSMEPDSAKRSSNLEYQFIEALMRHAITKAPIKLVREGIEYERDEIPSSRILSTLSESELQALKSNLGEDRHNLIKFATENDYKEKFFTHVEIILLQNAWPVELSSLRDKLVPPEAVKVHYRDTHNDFNRMYNVYLKCIRLNVPGSYDEANTVWRVEHAHRIREVMCVVQRICEENRPFYPNANFSAPALFTRSFKVKDCYTSKVVVLFDSWSGAFHDDFGSNTGSGFSIFKGLTGVGDGLMVVAPRLIRPSLPVDLIAVHRRMEDANINVDEFKPSLVLSRGPTH